MDVRFSMHRYLADQLTPFHSSSLSPSSTRTAKRLSLYGCGLVVINPPYLLDHLLTSPHLPFLSTALASEEEPAEFGVHWLNPEVTRERAVGLAELEEAENEGKSGGTQRPPISLT